jgi:hypothetical protein
MEAPDRSLTEDFARGVVDELAPGELPLFGAMSRAWFAAPERVRAATGRDDRLAFGVAEAAALVTPVLLSACTHIVMQFGQELGHGLAQEAAALVREQFHKLIRGEDSGLALSAEQVRKARQITLETARRYRVPDQKAEEIAKAVAGRLRRRA